MAAIATAATAAVAAGTRAARAAAADDLIAKVKDKSDKVRAEAMLGAGKVGAAAVKPLAGAMADADFEVARAARRALWNLVRYVGRPGADDEKKAAVTELIPLVGESQPVAVRREAAWMLSELAGDEAVEPVAALLSGKDLREDSRMVLERLPGEKSLAALKAGLAAAPEDFKPNVAISLRARGVEVAGMPDKRTVGSRETKVKAMTAAELQEAAKAAKSAKQKKGKKQ